MSEIAEAVQVFNLMCQIGNTVVSVPVKLVDGSIDLVQKVATIIDLSRRHKPVQGEVAMDEVFAKAKGAVTVFEVPDQVKEQVYQAFDKKDILYSFMPGTKGKTAVCVCATQTRKTTEALEEMQIEFQSAEYCNYIKNMPQEDYSRHQKENQVEREKEKKAGKTANFTGEGKNNEVQQAFLVGEYNEMLQNQNALRIRLMKESIIKEDGSTITVKLPGTEYTTEIAAKGIYPGTFGYFGFLMKDQVYEVNENGQKKEMTGQELQKTYFDQVLGEEEKEKRYYEALDQALKVQGDYEHAAPAQNPVIAEGYIQIKESQVLEQDVERGYKIRIPRYMYDHETSNRQTTEYGGQIVWIPSGLPDTNEKVSEKVHGINSRGEKIVQLYIPMEGSFALVKGEDETVVTGKQLYGNFNAVTEKQLIGSRKNRGKARSSNQMMPSMQSKEVSKAPMQKR